METTICKEEENELQQLTETLKAKIQGFAIERNPDPIRYLYDIGYFLHQNYLGNGGLNIDFSDKEYGYLSDDLDTIEVLCFGEEPDGSNQEYIKEHEPELTQGEYYNILFNRITSILEEL